MTFIDKTDVLLAKLPAIPMALAGVSFPWWHSWLEGVSAIAAQLVPIGAVILFGLKIIQHIRRWLQRPPID